MYRAAPQHLDEPYDTYDPRADSSPQRQHRRPRNPPSRQSRHSSSTGSNRTLRRTPRLQPRQLTGSRSPKTPERRAPRRLATPLAPSQSESLLSSASPDAAAQIFRNSSYWPKRSTFISKRTAEAVLYALEAIRGDPQGRLGSPTVDPSGDTPHQWKPAQFTPNLAEENALMSDLTGGGAMNGRSQNGGGLGPVPVPQQPGGDTGRVTPPTEIMRNRRARAARRREEERQREQTAGQRRSQEPPATEQMRPGAAGADDSEDKATSRRSGIRISRGDPQPVPVERRAPERGSGGSGRIADPGPSRISSRGHERISSLPQETTSVPAQQPRSRPRGQTLSNDQPRPAETVQTNPRAVSGPPLGSLDAQASQDRRTSRAAPASQTSPDQTGGQTRGGAEQTPRSNASSFPHAFERWEQLSSHWEGLTSYWIHRLEQNREDLEREPLNQQMARQVTDLSAAGANLFHAVVELQRLRASSERKFQRWFCETRAEQERARENQARLEQQLQNERQARTDNTLNSARYDNEIKGAYAAKALADVQVKEMRRELAISKDEARRAWEELGRREQEERDRTASLKAGHITLVGGVQVVPTASNRQPTSTLPSRDGTSGPEPVYTTYDPSRSDTDTDPFTEAARSTAEQPPLPSAQAYHQTSNGSAAAAQAARAATASESQSSGGRTAIRTAVTNPSANSNGNGTASIPAGSFYQHQGSSIHPEERPSSAPEADERSYVPSVSPTMSQDDYELDENGEVRRDAAGNPIVVRRGLGSEDSDEYNVRDQLEHERMLGRSYGSGTSGIEYGPSTTTAAPSGVDYEGRGFGEGWEAMPRHHHPTRLSDVMEEDERSRTSPSRASQASRGLRDRG